MAERSPVAGTALRRRPHLHPQNYTQQQLQCAIARRYRLPAPHWQGKGIERCESMTGEFIYLFERE